MAYKVVGDKLIFDCGCSFDVIGQPPFPKSDLPLIRFNADLSKEDHTINFDCPAVWEIFERGITRGVFQLGSDLGKQESVKLKPVSLVQLAALVSLLRPGALKAFDDKGVNMTTHYRMRKNGEEEVTYFHPSLEPILNETFGISVFQEQSLRIVRDLADFTESEADSLRKAIGKKIASEMAKVRVKFMDGCKKLGIVTEKEAEQIFDWIEQSQRYQFNKSHAFGYAVVGYVDAYTKYHFPVQFYTAQMKRCQDRADTYDMFNIYFWDAKLMDVSVRAPSILRMNNFFTTDGESVFYGISDIRGVGRSVLDSIKQMLEANNLNIKTVDWYTFLRRVLNNISSDVVRKLIESSALNHFRIPRRRMLKEYEILHTGLTKGERAYVLNDPSDNLVDSLKNCAKKKKDGGGCHTDEKIQVVKGFIKSLESPPFPLTDSPDWSIIVEKEALGVSLTYSELDKYDVSRASHSCRDIMNGYKRYAVLAVKLSNVRVHQIGKGKNKGKEMAFMSINDDTCALDSVVAFNDVFEEYSAFLSTGNIVYLAGKVNKTGSFQVEKVYPME